MDAQRDSGHRRITRRLFLIFVAFAMLPVVTISAIAVQYISSTARQQLERMLENEVDAFGDLALGRLGVASRRLELYARELAAERGSAGGGTAPRDREVTVTASLRYSRIGANFLIDPLYAEAREHLQTGRPLLVTDAGARGDAVQLLRAIDPAQPAAGLVAAQITENFLFGEPDERNLNLETCIYGADGGPLFASRREVCAAFEPVDSGHRGQRRRAVAGDDYYMTWRSLFMREQYLVGDWRVSVATPDANVLRASVAFRNTFIAFALLALLALSLLSIRLISRQMSPLDALMAGIERVSRQQYDEDVSVDSGDEFETMAGAFNNMSRRVSRQITTLGSMSEIDQLILARGNKEDILRIVLQKTRVLLPGERFALLLPAPDDPAAASLYTLEENNEDALRTHPVSLPGDYREAPWATALTVLAPDDPQRPGFLRVLRHSDDHTLELIPVRTDKRLVAILVVGLPPGYRPDAEAQELAERYADRIAVALSNAEWEAKLYQQANYDALTGLPNRPALLDELRRRIARARRDELSFGVIFVDLDNFKLINDSLGHESGDRFIGMIAERLGGALRDNDFVARLGGDEFIIISSEAPTREDTFTSMHGIANRILIAVQAPLTMDGSEIRATASLGIAVFPRDGEDTSALMKNADLAMYHAKAEGPGRFQFYSEELNSEGLELMQLSTDLKAALERDEFVLHYQPKVAAEGHAILGAEALIRWQHPTRGLLSPGAFIGAAETLGLINAIGNWALENTCRQLQAWRRAGLAPVVPVSVNIAATQIQQENLAARLQALIVEYDVRGDDLELEITESVLVKRVDETIEKLQAIRALGASISIDDYGTGYSSLSYMKHLPVNKLKIDGSFIRDLDTDSADQAIVSSAIVLARQLGMTVIAEGVETAQQLARLQEYGCDEIQGFYFSRPVDADALAALVTRRAFEVPPA